MFPCENFAWSRTSLVPPAREMKLPRGDAELRTDCSQAGCSTTVFLPSRNSPTWPSSGMDMVASWLVCRSDCDEVLDHVSCSSVFILRTTSLPSLLPRPGQADTQKLMIGNIYQSDRQAGDIERTEKVQDLAL